MKKVIPHLQGRDLHVLCWDDGIIEKIEELNLKVNINLVIMTNVSMVSFLYADICFLPSSHLVSLEHIL